MKKKRKYKKLLTPALGPDFCKIFHRGDTTHKDRRDKRGKRDCLWKKEMDT